MTGGANNRFFSRMMVVSVVALAFAGCAAMLSAGNRSLFADITYAAHADTGR
jgi:hypothetical protein